jgi:hypothetical protein
MHHHHQQQRKASRLQLLTTSINIDTEYLLHRYGVSRHLIKAALTVYAANESRGIELVAIEDMVPAPGPLKMEGRNR